MVCSNQGAEGKGIAANLFPSVHVRRLQTTKDRIREEADAGKAVLLPIKMKIPFKAKFCSINHFMSTEE